MTHTTMLKHVLTLNWLIMYYFSTIISSKIQFGRDTFECPDGFHISMFASVYNPRRRAYEFSCSPIAKETIASEKCHWTDPISTMNGDLYVTCEDAEYTAGISRMFDGEKQIWSMMCCESAQVKVRHESCITTPFLNAIADNFEFSSGMQVIRKWQAIYDDVKSDRRWWLQLCPVDHIDPPKHSNPAVVDHRRFTRSATRDPFGRRRLQQQGVVQFAEPFELVETIVMLFTGTLPFSLKSTGWSLYWSAIVPSTSTLPPSTTTSTSTTTSGVSTVTYTRLSQSSSDINSSELQSTESPNSITYPYKSYVNRNHLTLPAVVVDPTKSYNTGAFRQEISPNSILKTDGSSSSEPIQSTSSAIRPFLISNSDRATPVQVINTQVDGGGLKHLQLRQNEDVLGRSSSSQSDSGKVNPADTLPPGLRQFFNDISGSLGPLSSGLDLNVDKLGDGLDLGKLAGSGLDVAQLALPLVNNNLAASQPRVRNRQAPPAHEFSFSFDSNGDIRPKEPSSTEPIRVGIRDSERPLDIFASRPVLKERDPPVERPNTIEPKVPGEPGAIQNTLEFLGLCNPRTVYR